MRIYFFFQTIQLKNSYHSDLVFFFLLLLLLLLFHFISFLFEYIKPWSSFEDKVWVCVLGCVLLLLCIVYTINTNTLWIWELGTIAECAYRCCVNRPIVLESVQSNGSMYNTCISFLIQLSILLLSLSSYLLYISCMM